MVQWDDDTVESKPKTHKVIVRFGANGDVLLHTSVMMIANSRINHELVCVVDINSRVCCPASPRTWRRSASDRPMARQHTRELMSTAHNHPWLVPIITWLQQFWSLSLNILLIKRKSKLESFSHNDLTAVCTVMISLIEASHHYTCHVPMGPFQHCWLSVQLHERTSIQD